MDEAHKVATAEDQPVSSDAVSWTASEFIAHDKSVGWYIGLAAAAVLIAGVIYLLTKDFISTGVVLVGALALGWYGARKPRQLPYQLNTKGVQIGNKWHGYQDFRSFSIVPEGAFSSIVFMPLKRFAPLTTIYYAPEDEEKIVSILSGILPYEERKSDPIDSLMQRIRF